MKARDFLELADELAIGNGEAEWRSAASRAYYSAFHFARELLTSLGFDVPQSDRAHTYLMFRLSNAADQLLNRTANQLSDMRSARNAADYDLKSEFGQRAVAEAVVKATEVVLVLEEYLAEPARFPAIANAIAIYDRDVLREVTYRAAGPSS